MRHFHNPTFRLLALTAAAAACLLSACATAEPQAMASADQEAAKKPRQYVTGSRIPSGNSPQIVRSISGSSANETLRSQPNPGRPGN